MRFKYLVSLGSQLKLLVFAELAIELLIKGSES